MKQDKKLENIVAKDKGYSSPRCAYCTETINTDEDSRFSLMSDGKLYPTHKACNEEHNLIAPPNSHALDALLTTYEAKNSELCQKIQERRTFNSKRTLILLTESTIAFFGTKITTGKYDEHAIGNDLLKVIISSLFAGMAYPAGIAVPCFIGAYSTLSIMQAMGDHYHGWRRTRELEEEKDLVQRQVVGARIDFMNRKKNEANLKLKDE